MFNAIGFIIKVVVFSSLVLIIGNYAKWDGRTISDQIKTHLSHAETSEIADQVRDLTKKITSDAKDGFEKKNKIRLIDSDEIQASERQKLRALIRELNGSQKKD